MLKAIIPATVILMFISGCACPHTKIDTSPAYTSHQYSSHDLNISWKSEKTDSGIRIVGTVTNVRNDLPYNSLELTAKLLDEKGNILAKDKHVFPERFAGSEPFRMDIPIEKMDMVKRIKFSYSYGTVEDHYLQHFDSEP